MDWLRPALDAELLSWPQVTTRFMFGCLAYMAKGKLFAFISDEDLVVTNLDKESRKNLTESFEAFPFLFKGKPFGGWTEVSVGDESQVHQIMDFIRESYQAALAKSGKSKKNR